MNRNQSKSQNLRKTILITSLAVIIVRISILLLFTLLAYLTNDPASNVTLYSIISKIMADTICGFVVARALGSDFSTLTRTLFSVFVITVITITEMLLGKAVFQNSKTTFLLIPLAMICAAVGAFRAYGKTPKKHSKRKKKKHSK